MSDLTSPTRLAPIAGTVKLDASCGVAATPYKEGTLPPMTPPAERCLSGGDFISQNTGSHLRRT